MPAAAVLKVGLGLAAAVGVGLVAMGAAQADSGPRKMPPELRARIIAVLKTADPAQIRSVALEVEKAGFPESAKSLQQAADAIERAIKDVTPSPILPPAPEPGGEDKRPADSDKPLPPAVREARVMHVQRGEGPFQMAQRVGLNHPLDRALELRDANIPFDADGGRRKSDGARGFLPILEPGDRLLVPASWPEHPDITVEKVGVPVSVSGDAPNDQRHLRKLAGRVALEVEHSPRGSESREIVEAFQRAHHQRGERRGACDGRYDPETVMLLIVHHGIAAPLRFADGLEIYWPSNPQNAGRWKRRLRQTVQTLAAKDKPRRDEWKQVAANI